MATIPVSYTNTEREMFNAFWMGLSHEDKEIFQGMMERTHRNWHALRRPGPYVTFQQVLMLLIMENQAAIDGLAKKVERLLAVDEVKREHQRMKHKERKGRKKLPP